jgi:hypothetical protein
MNTSNSKSCGTAPRPVVHDPSVLAHVNAYLDEMGVDWRDVGGCVAHAFDCVTGWCIDIQPPECDIVVDYFVVSTCDAGTYEVLF